MCKKLVFLIVLSFCITLGQGLYERRLAASQPVPPNIILDGKRLNLDAVIIQGQTLVPLRAIFESFGAKVQYGESSKVIVATKENDILTYMIGDNFAYVNNRLIKLNILPVVRNGITYIPLRFAGEAFAANILWDNTTRNIIIRSPKNNQNQSIAKLRSGYLDPMYWVDKSKGPLNDIDPYIKKSTLSLLYDHKSKFITITNISDTDIDLSDWKLKLLEKSNIEFTFGKGLKLPAGQNVRLALTNQYGDFIWDAIKKIEEGKPNAILFLTPKDDVVLRWEG